MIEINLERHSCIINNKEIDLTTREFQLLYFLYKNKGKYFTQDQLVKEIWNESSSKVASTTMTRLRKKIGKDAIKTRYNLGYILE